MEHLTLILGLVILGYATISALVPQTILSAPIILVAVGVLVSQTLGIGIEEGHAAEVLEVLAELTLVLLLFTDASRISARALIEGFSLPTRMLAVGLPLTIGLGLVIGRLLFPDFTWWEVALLSAILAPTDAALGQAVVSNEQVPARIRQTLNVESGLNDGIVVPFVMLFAALAATHVEFAGVAFWVQFVSKQLILGPLYGLIVGFVGGRMIESAAKRGWMDDSFRKLSGLALAMLAWAIATSTGGNGFIAAFVCGMTIGASTMVIKPAVQEFGETEGQLLSLLSFLLFGAVFVFPTLRSAGSADWCYALLSLTVIRILPVAVSLIGTRTQFATTMFLGWFGPRGLASLIFALVVTRESSIPHGEQIFTVAMLTATLSIFAHGMTAVPASVWYARVVNRHICHPGCEHQPVVELPLRHKVVPCDMSGEKTSVAKPL